MPYAPTINVMNDAAPCPQAEVLFTSFAPNTTTVTVYRISGSRQSRVRAAVNVRVAGSLSRVDYEIPAGVDSYYRAEMFNSAGGSLGFTDPATATAVFSDTWVHNPLNPAGAVRVAFRDTAARELRRPVMGEVVYPVGRQLGVLISGQRSGFRGVNLDVITDTIQQADKFQALFGDYEYSTVPVLCFRLGTNDRVRLPRPLFAAVTDPVEEDMNYVLGGSQIAYALQGDEVAPPAEALIVPLLRNTDLKAYYATNAAQKADNITNLAEMRRYDLAGLGI